MEKMFRRNNIITLTKTLNAKTLNARRAIILFNKSLANWNNLIHNAEYLVYLKMVMLVCA